jgi:hypothetical protein
MTSETSSTEEATTNPSPFRSVTDVQDITSDTTKLPETDSQQPITESEKADGVFVGYEFDNGVPYIIDYFGVNETYKADPSMYDEAGEITQYLQDLVTTGEIDNSIVAVRAKLKQLEQLSGIEESDRINMKLTKLVEYAKFENKINQAKRNSIKWSR